MKITCDKCSAEVTADYVFCGMCGHKLTSLELKNVPSSPRIPSIHENMVFINDASFSGSSEAQIIQFQIQNTGKTTAHLRFPEQKNDLNVLWVEQTIINEIQDNLIILEPQDATLIYIYVNPEEIFIDREAYLNGRKELDDIIYTLNISTQGLIYEEETASSMQFVVPVRPELPCVPTSNASIYRFIDQDSLKSGKLQHVVNLQNLSSRPVTLKRILFSDYMTLPTKPLGFSFDGKTSHPDLKRIPFSTCFPADSRLNVVIPPLHTQPVSIPFLPLKEDVCGWFASTIRFHVQNELPSKAYISGFIGKRPSLSWIKSKGYGVHNNIANVNLQVSHRFDR